MDCSPPDSSVHWISQARIMNCIAIFFPLQGIFPTPDQSCVICTGRQILYHGTIREAPVEYYSAIKKEQVWISSGEVDEPRACYTEWSMSEREKQILFINAYIWNVEKLYWWNCLQDRNRDTDQRQTRGHSMEGEGGMNWESSIDIYTIMWKTDNS